MAFIPVPDVCAVRIFTGNANLEWSNTFYFHRSGFSDEEQDDLTEAVHGAWGNAIKTSLDAAYTTKYSTSYNLESETAHTYTYSDGPVAGVDVGEELPVQDAMVVTFRTNYRGRGGRGRIYVAGFNESAMQGSGFTVGEIANVINAVQAVELVAQGLGWSFVIVHRYEDKAPLQTGQSRAIVSYTVRSGIPGVQRRRSRRP
jgi:hypothetical protein